MSKSAKKNQREQRKAAKRARKLANYVRFGPKSSGKGRGGKKLKAHQKTVAPGEVKPQAPTKTSAKGRSKRRKNGLNMTVKKR